MADPFRVLILAPTDADADVAARLLAKASIVSLACKDVRQVCSEMTQAAGALLIAEEALISDGAVPLIQRLSQQPPWSDLPVVVLGTSSTSARWSEIPGELFDSVGNLTLLERPFSVATLISAVRVALRGRRKQYEVRELLVSESNALRDAAASMERAQLSESARKIDEERLRLAAEAGRLGLWNLDLRTREISCTERFKTIVGWPLDKPIFQAEFWSRIHAEDLDDVKVAMQRAVAGGQDYSHEYRVSWPDGSTRWVLSRGRVTQYEDVQPRNMTGIIQDITDRKLAEVAREGLLESERAARAHAERLGRLKDEFLATLSHELRTPLNAVVGWITILRRGGARRESDLAKGLEVIERNARLQTQLINDMLDMSRIISGKMRLEIDAADLRAIAEEAIETIRPAVLAKGLQIRTQLGIEGCPVYGDPARLQQILWNLLSNAVKFTPSGGTIEVALQRGAEGPVLEVRDDGQGISSGFLMHLFERFRQADGSTTRSHGGLGLGLSIVRHLVELHGGTIEAHSGGEGKGALFRVQLPMLHALPHAPEQSQSIAPQLPTAAKHIIMERLSGARVLVVDDDPDALDLVARILSGAGAEVLTAASVAAALQFMYAAQSPDLIVSDISMPDRDGYDFARSVRCLPPAQGAATPMIALTAFARQAERDRALEAGFDEHVSKPIEADQLLRACAHFLKHPSAPGDHEIAPAA